MKILHVIASMDPAHGGPAQGIRNLDTAMRIVGVEREVVCLDASDALYLGRDKFKIHALGKGIGPWRYNSKLKRWLLSNLERFDVVIINGLWLYTGFITWRTIQRMKLSNSQVKIPKLFVMPHGMLDPYFQKAPERKWKSRRNKIYWKLIEKRVINDADGLLFTCQTELLLAREAFENYCPRQEHNVGYGIVPPPLFEPTMADALLIQCPELAGQKYWLFLSRIHPKKGIDNLIKAYLEIHRKFSSKTCIPKLVIAGPGMNSAYGEALKQGVEKAPELDGSVIFPGMMSGEFKWGAFYGCEAFILPSHQENFGIAVVEALACGKPVLISNQVNIWREIEENGSGIIAADDVSGAEQLLTSWLNLSIDQRTIMHKQATKTFERYFLVYNVVDNYLKVFDEALVS